jgi:hypothetical protein
MLCLHPEDGQMRLGSPSALALVQIALKVHASSEHPTEWNKSLSILIQSFFSPSQMVVLTVFISKYSPSQRSFPKGKPTHNKYIQVGFSPN